MAKKIMAMLHPGEMGAAVGACLVSAGHRVVWASAGRSAATRARAKADFFLCVLCGKRFGSFPQ